MGMSQKPARVTPQRREPASWVGAPDDQEADPWPGCICHSLCPPRRNGLMRTPTVQEPQLEGHWVPPCFLSSLTPVIQAQHQRTRLVPLFTAVLNVLASPGDIGGNSKELENRFNEIYSPKVPKCCGLCRRSDSRATCSIF